MLFMPIAGGKHRVNRDFHRLPVPVQDSTVHIPLWHQETFLLLYIKVSQKQHPCHTETRNFHVSLRLVNLV